MKGWVAGFHGYGLKGDDYGLKGCFFLRFLLYGFKYDHNFLTYVPNYDVLNMFFFKVTKAWLNY